MGGRRLCSLEREGFGVGGDCGVGLAAGSIKS